MATDSSPFRYFNGLIFFVLCTYIVILAVFLIIRRRHVKRDIENRGLNNNDAAADPLDDAMFAFELTTRFEDVTQSSWRGMKVILAIYRFAMTIFFLGFAVILNSIQYAYGVYFFTNWNALLVTLYFLLAFCASAINIATVNCGNSRYEMGTIVLWSTPVRLLGMLVHLCFEVAGASSMFVCLFDNLFLSPADINPLIRAVGALAVVALSFELLLSTIRVRFDQFPAVVAFIMLYLLIMWPSVFTGVLRDWPYNVFRTDTADCFGYYALVFVLDFVFYCCWYGFYRMKKRIMIQFNMGRAAARLSEYFFDEGEEFDETDEFGDREETFAPFSHMFHPAAAAAAPSGYGNAGYVVSHGNGHGYGYEMTPAMQYPMQYPVQYPMPADPNSAMYSDPNYFGQQQQQQQQHYDHAAAGRGIPQRQASYIADDPYASFYGETAAENEQYRQMARTGLPLAPGTVGMAGTAGAAPLSLDNSDTSRYSMYSTGSYSYYGGGSSANAAGSSYYDSYYGGANPPIPTSSPSIAGQQQQQQDEEDPYMRQRRQYATPAASSTTTAAAATAAANRPLHHRQLPLRQQSEDYGSGYYDYNPTHPDDVLMRGVPSTTTQQQQQQQHQEQQSYYGSSYFEFNPWDAETEAAAGAAAAVTSKPEGVSRRPFQDPLDARSLQQQQTAAVAAAVNGGEGKSAAGQVQLRPAAASLPQQQQQKDDESRMDDLVARRIAKLGFSQKPVNRSWQEHRSSSSHDSNGSGEGGGDSIGIAVPASAAAIGSSTATAAFTGSSGSSGILSSGASVGDDSSTSESLKLNEVAD